MIQFSVFLQGNEQSKMAAKEKKAKEQQLKQEKEEEQQANQKKIKFLQKKDERIELKKKALSKYKDYLEMVREQNPDDFEEVDSIKSRYQTLVSENKKLDNTIEMLDNQLKTMKDNRIKYIKDKETGLVKLNNEISQKKTILEKINEQINAYKLQAEEENRKKFGKFSELAQILMAIENIQVKCEERAEKYRKVSKLIRHNTNKDYKPENFNSPRRSVEYAKLQLQTIKKFLVDYIEITNSIKKDPFVGADIRKYLDDLKSSGDLI